MIRVAIAGKNSYIGRNAAAALREAGMEVCEVSVHGPWEPGDFAGYDAVLCVAGIVHKSDDRAEQYYAVNRDLTLRVARAARDGGAKQFVFLSSMSVYGLTVGRITRDTPPRPSTHYGASKWQAEQGLERLASDRFRVAVLRPPMVYGPGCKGNYQRLSALAQYVSFFPRINNERSMLFIGTLCAFLVGLIKSGEGGLYFPQEPAYVNTSEMVRLIAQCHGRRLRLVPGLDRLIHRIAPRVQLVGKLFGSLTYDQDMSRAFLSPNALSLEQTIRLTEENA